MQLRKLQRLLKEAEKKHGKYIEVCVDRDFIEAHYDEWKYISISDVEVHSCVWNREESVNENQRNVLVLGNE